jgi:hypothetical protein
MATTVEGRRDTAVVTELIPVQAQVVDYDPRWRQPVIPVFAEAVGWADLWDFIVTRWAGLPGMVVLGVWTGLWGDDEDKMVATQAPGIELMLPIEEPRLTELLNTGGGTMAVIEFPGVNEGEQPWAQWVGVNLDIGGLAEAIEHAEFFARRAGPAKRLEVAKNWRRNWVYVPMDQLTDEGGAA